MNSLKKREHNFECMTTSIEKKCYAFRLWFSQLSCFVFFFLFNLNLKCDFNLITVKCRQIFHFGCRTLTYKTYNKKKHLKTSDTSNLVRVSKKKNTEKKCAHTIFVNNGIRHVQKKRCSHNCRAADT